MSASTVSETSAGSVNPVVHVAYWDFASVETAKNLTKANRQRRVKSERLRRAIHVRCSSKRTSQLLLNPQQRSPLPLHLDRWPQAKLVGTKRPRVPSLATFGRQHGIRNPKQLQTSASSARQPPYIRRRRSRTFSVASGVPSWNEPNHLSQGMGGSP